MLAPISNEICPVRFGLTESKDFAFLQLLFFVYQIDEWLVAEGH